MEVTALTRLARERAAAAQASPLVGPITTGLAHNVEAVDLRDLSELLLDCYLDLAETGKGSNET